MSGLTQRIRELINTGIPVLQCAIDESEYMLRDFEAGAHGETPIDPRRVDTPVSVNRPRASNRAQLSPIAAPVRRHIDTSSLREVWDPLRAELETHLDRERVAVYPLVLHVLEGRIADPGVMATPITQMIAEHMSIDAALPGLLEAAGRYEEIAPQLIKLASAFQRHSRIEESEIFPELILLIDPSVSPSATPLPARRSPAGAGPRARSSNPPDGTKTRIRAWGWLRTDEVD